MLTAEQNRLGMRLYELDKAGDCLGVVALEREALPRPARRAPCAVRRAGCNHDLFNCIAGCHGLQGASVWLQY